MTARRKRRANTKFYIFLGAVAAIAVVVLFFAFQMQTATVKVGTIPFETEVTAVIVRDEQVVSAQNYGKANYLVSEGERVEAGAPVMQVYKWGYNEKVLNDLIDYQTKIEQYQENGFSSEEFQNLQKTISEKAVEIRDIVSGVKDGDIVTAERELETLLAQKQQYLKDNVAADQQLQEFYAQEQEIQGRVENWVQELTAESAGVVSYYFDGSEEVLNAANIENIKSADITGILYGTGAQQGKETQEEEEKPVYRLVNSFKWYLVVHSDQEIPELINGQDFSIAFDEYSSRQYQGKVTGTVKEDDEGYLYILEISDDIGELLNVRRADAKIFTQFTGLEVPEKALREQDGVWGVDVVIGDAKTFVPVTVNIIKDGTAIVTPVEENSPLSEGQQIEV